MSLALRMELLTAILRLDLSCRHRLVEDKTGLHSWCEIVYRGVFSSARTMHPLTFGEVSLSLKSEECKGGGTCIASCMVCSL